MQHDESLGSCEKIEITKDKTTIINGYGEADQDIQSRIDQFAMYQLKKLHQIMRKKNFKNV
jgi:hypothetical protein